MVRWAQYKFMNKGFTLVELIVTMAIIAILYGVVMFCVSLYVNIGKDSNISGGLATLIPTGEVWYNGNNNSYIGFCTTGVNGNSVLNNISNSISGIVCNIPSSQSWVACAPEFVTANTAWCVDSRAVSEQINTTSYPCNSSLTQCP